MRIVLLEEAYILVIRCSHLYLVLKSRTIALSSRNTFAVVLDPFYRIEVSSSRRLETTNTMLIKECFNSWHTGVARPPFSNSSSSQQQSGWKCTGFDHDTTLSRYRDGICV